MNEFLTGEKQGTDLKSHQSRSEIPNHASNVLNQYMEQKRNGQFPAFSDPYQSIQNPT